MTIIVRILLSTYNGEKFLEEQLDSLLKQTYSEIEIFIRDDGSTDNTLSIVKEYASSHNNIYFFSEKNIGIVDSFFTLLEYAAFDEVEYFAFCDQDDIWKPDKVQRAVWRLESEKNHKSNPIMYCSGYTLFNTNTKQKIDMPINPINPSFSNALVENIALGCTVVLNRMARDLVISRRPRKATMHDSWCYLVISALGKVIFDPYPSIFYRQHDNNVIGSSMTFRKKWQKKIQGYRKRQGVPLLSIKVDDFFRLFKDDLDENKTRLIEKFLSNKTIDRVKMVLTGSFYKQSTMDNLIYKVLYLFKKI